MGGISMSVATACSLILSRWRKIQAWYVVSFSLGIGWFIGSNIVFFTMTTHMDFVSTAAVWASMLLLMTFFFNIGPLLVRCDPDDFLRIVLTNTVLLMVVTVPFLLVVAFCFTARRRQLHDRAEQEVQQEIAPNIPSEMQAAALGDQGLPEPSVERPGHLPIHQHAFAF